MNKIKFLFVLPLISAFFAFPSPIHAAFVHITTDGNAIWNVLGEESTLTAQKPESIDITRVSNTTLALFDAQVSLTKNAGNVVLDVKNETGEHQADVTNIKDNLIEIEARPQTQKVTIGYKDEQFVITQNSVAARTTFPITINAKTNEISVTTPSGLRVLTILPFEASTSAMKANVLSQNPELAEITESPSGELSYLLSGKKELNFFNVIPYKFDTKVYVSAITGEVLKVDPGWFKILGFLFG